MRTTTLLLTLLAIAATPAMAQLTEFTAFEGRADCNGWSVDATVYYREYARMMRLEYAVVLSDTDGVEVERSEYADWLVFDAGQSAAMPLSGSWTNTPSDGWTVRGDFLLLDMEPDAENRDTAAFTASLDCGTEPGDGVDPIVTVCAYPPVWYRNHPDEWPGRQLELGGQILDENAIMQLLKRRNRGRLPVMLARQVVAAKFNLILNPDAGVDEVIVAADAWLAVHSPFHRYSRRHMAYSSLRQELPTVRRLIGPLLRLNFSGCKDVPADGSAVTAALEDVDKAFDDIPADEEDVSFGALKAMYR
ncbi:MAG: hypothetical protein GY838_03495 [bacterium]|nr:hypothetical protein [bacterium]